MSAKNRGTEPQAADQYMTPPPLAQACVDAAIATLPTNRINLRILEPSAGVGAFVAPLSKHGKVTANEDNAAFRWSLKQAGAAHIRIGRTETLRGKPYDLILGNPPYSLAADHIDCLRKLLNANGRLFMLLRVNFLGAQCRREFWNRNPLSALHIIRPRAHFLDAIGDRLRGKNGQPANDATEYALFEWRYLSRDRNADVPFSFIDWKP